MSNYQNFENVKEDNTKKDIEIKELLDFVKVLEKEINYLQNNKDKLEEEKKVSVQAANE